MTQLIPLKTIRPICSSVLQEERGTLSDPYGRVKWKVQGPPLRARQKGLGVPS